MAWWKAALDHARSALQAHTAPPPSSPNPDRERAAQQWRQNSSARSTQRAAEQRQAEATRVQNWQNWQSQRPSDILLRGTAPSVMYGDYRLNPMRPSALPQTSRPARQQSRESTAERHQRQSREAAQRALRMGQMHSERLRAMQGYDRMAGRETPSDVAGTLAEQRQTQSRLQSQINDPDAFLPDSDNNEDASGERDNSGTNLEARRRLLQSRVTYLTQDEYNALSDREKAAAQFNAGLAAASRRDDEAGNTDATRNYLSKLGIVAQDEKDLDSFLQLDRLIGSTIMEQLSRPVTSGSDDYAFELLRQRGSPSVLLKDRIDQARSDTNRAALALSDLYGQQGVGNLDGTTAGQSGYGTTGRDQVILEAYLNMIDSEHTLTAQDVVDGIAYMNQVYGTDVSPQEVWDFASAQLQAQEFAREGGTGRGLRMGASGPETPQLINEGETNPFTGETIIPLSPEEIRKRYNL